MFCSVVSLVYAWIQLVCWILLRIYCAWCGCMVWMLRIHVVCSWVVYVVVIMCCWCVIGYHDEYMVYDGMYVVDMYLMIVNAVTMVWYSDSRLMVMDM